MTSVLLPRASRCSLCAAIWTAPWPWRAHDFRCWVWPTTPAGPGFLRLRIFAYRLYDSVSGCPGKRRPLEGLNSIVSAGPRDLHHNKICTNGVRVHSTVTGGGCQVSQEIGSMKKTHFVAGEYGGSTLRFFGAAVGPGGGTSRVQSRGWGCRFLMDRALQRRTQRQPTPRGRRPPLYPRGGGV
jgi:hypothetical protein